MLPVPCTATLCYFDKTPTLSIVLFELLILICTGILLFLLSKLTKHVLQKYFIIMIGVFLFELFTAPMWNNFKLGSWAYIYVDISWILTFGWTSLIMYITFLVDTYFRKSKLSIKFLLYILILTPLVLFFESAAVKLGIRSYSPEVAEVVNNKNIAFLDIPVAGLYYIPVFMTLVISFYKYWEFVLEKKLLIPVNRHHFIRKLLLTFIGVILFELMIEPMVQNVNLPQWAYIYRDVNLVMSGIWVVVVTLVVTTIDTFLIHLNLQQKFIGYLLLTTAVTAPLEAWFISAGYRLYGPSATANFSGFKSILFHVPVEVLFAVPFYLALVICFTKFWDVVIDNNL